MNRPVDLSPADDVGAPAARRSTVGAAQAWAQARLGNALRSRVAGPHGPERAKRIWESAGPRWFGPDDPIWRVHADAAMFVGGIRALLLQSLHPLAMAGVTAHSGFRGDPWGRLQRTSYFLATTTYGTVADAEEMITRVRRIHATVTGTAGDGRNYAASDPHLLGWVHVAEVDSFLTAYQRLSGHPLDDADADRYVAQTALVAQRLGVVDPPLSVPQVRRQLDAYRPELHGGPEARATARFLLLTPPLPVAARPGYAALAGAAVALLPGWARRPLLLPHLPVTERLITVPIGTAATSVIRWAMAAPADG